MQSIRLPLVALAATAALAGCGSSSSSSSSSGAASTPTATPASTATTQAPTGGTPSHAAGGTSLKLAADPSGQLAFDSKALSAKAGPVTITFTNAAPLAHNLTLVSGAGGKTIAATPTFAGGSKTLSLSLKPGTYTFECTVPGHAQAGMVGTLTVR